jgi:hypothetical protein
MVRRLRRVIVGFLAVVGLLLRVLERGVRRLRFLLEGTRLGFRARYHLTGGRRRRSDLVS